MEIIIELFVEVIGQFLLEVVAEAGFRGVGRILSNRVVRVVLGTLTSLGIGFGGGFWWGARLSELGRTAPPSSLWVSVALAAAFVVVALIQTVRHRTEPEALASGGPEGIRSRLSPWRWSPERLLGFAALNGSVAVGIAVGFTPQPLL